MRIATKALVFKTINDGGNCFKYQTGTVCRSKVLMVSIFNIGFYLVWSFK